MTHSERASKEYNHLKTVNVPLFFFASNVQRISPGIQKASQLFLWHQGQCGLFFLGMAPFKTESLGCVLYLSHSNMGWGTA